MKAAYSDRILRKEKPCHPLKYINIRQEKRLSGAPVLLKLILPARVLRANKADGTETKQKFSPENL